VSNFWADRLGTAPAAPAAPPAQPQAAPQQGPWWQAPQPVQPQQAPPQQTVVVEQEYTTDKAQSARSTETCPECGSGNVFKPKGQPNAMPQCYHCGWNPRFEHSTAGAGMPSDKSVPVQSARQISGGGGAGGVSNYNPSNIVAHIDK
jgi:hypothetical protein